MDQNTLILILVGVVILVAIAIWFTMRKQRTDRLQGRFGDEYDRTVESKGDRAAAEAALEEREERVDALEIRSLNADEHARFADEWKDVKAVFVDSPTEAVLHADRMLGNMMKTVGYPMADFDRRYEDLTVNHGDVARHYREGHEITDRHNSGNASTEDMRQAMNHYQALYDHLTNDAEPIGAHSTAGRTTAAPQSEAVDVDGDGEADVVREDLDGDGDTDRVRSTH